VPTAVRAAGFSEDGVRERFSLFERTVEYKVNCIVMYVCGALWC